MHKRFNEVKYGALLSYILIAANAVYGLIIAPFILGQIGESEYGVYKTIASMTASVSVLELGLGGTMQRYIAKFRTERQTEESYNFSAMGMIQACAISVAIFLVGIPLFLSLDSVYGATFSSSELVRAKQLFLILIIYVALHIFENVLSGMISGYNKFTFVNSLKLVVLALKVLLYVIVLPIVRNSLVIVFTSVFLELFTIIVEYIYLTLSLHHKIKLVKWDGILFRDSCKYTFWMFLTSIAAQVNNNVDNVMIGALRGPELVAVYSYGLTLFAMYESLSTAVSNVMLPTVMQTIKNDPDNVNIQNLVIKAGRFQFAMLGAAIVGFFCVGRQFIRLWLGEGFLDVYPIALILMIPSMFELCVNVCLAILRAKNKLAFRTLTLFGVTILNIILTWLLVSKWNYIGAALGTAASFIVGSVIIMNIYYQKIHKLNMIKIYSSIFERIWLCLLVAGVALYISSRFIVGGLLAFAANVIIFLIVYIILLQVYGFSKDEWNSLFHRRKNNG